MSAPAKVPSPSLITLARQSDDTVSVRVEGKEVAILPDRLHCTLQDLERAFRSAENALPSAVPHRIAELELRIAELIQEGERRANELQQDIDSLEKQLDGEKNAAETLENLTW
jgi:hypothetical protein